jgi:hypothetical protein
MIAFIVIILLWFLAGSLLTLALGYPLKSAYQVGLLSVLIVLFWTLAIISRSDRARRFWEYLDHTTRREGQRLSCAVVLMVVLPFDTLIVAGVVAVIRWLLN